MPRQGSIKLGDLSSLHIRCDRPTLLARLARSMRALAGVPGWRRLVDIAVRAHSAPFSISNGGTRFQGDIGSYIDRQVYLFGGYELEKLEAFNSQKMPNGRGVILDIGANVGTHSLEFARWFETVHAFEPNPYLWDQFTQNVSANGLSNVLLHRIGLADRDEELPLYAIDKPNFGLGTSDSRTVRHALKNRREQLNTGGINISAGNWGAEG